MSEKYLDNTTTIPVRDPSFRAVVENGGVTKLPEYLEEAELAKGQIFVVSDDNFELMTYHASRVVGALSKAGMNQRFFSIHEGEPNKSLAQVGDLIETLSEAGATRKDTIVAVGGGVVGDLVGFVASALNRGVNLVHVPTTLLAMVDSSIGGKTGVDHGGKNKTGSFYQPKLVVADPTVLETLPQRVYTEGFGEIAKYAVIDKDVGSLEWALLEGAAEKFRTYNDDVAYILGRIIAKSVELKTAVVADDAFEDKELGRVILNYGHTLGHGLEAAGGYSELLHGEAVAIGMTFAAKLAVERGLLDQDIADWQTDLLQRLGLPTQYSGHAGVAEIMKHIAKDKKNLGAGETRFVLPRRIGLMAEVVIANSDVATAVDDFLHGEK